MAFCQPLSPITNALSTPKRPAPTKYVSPSTSRTVAIQSPASAVSTFTDQDESRQRKERRRVSQVFDLQRKPLGSPNASSPRQADALSGLTHAQVSSHYADCIKLSAENKINAKNAFGLHLIDYMTELVKKKELESFQVASSTLDASVKIYAGRVDHIHTHTYKVLSGLGGGKTGNDAEAEGVDGEEETSEATMKTKKKKKGKAHTIETNLKNINIDKFDLEFEVDPMFQMMSTAFDEGGARGLLLNRLHCFDSSQHLVLDSSTVVNVVEDNLPDSQSFKKPVSISDVKDLLASMSLEDKMICPSMANFHFRDSDGDGSIFRKDMSAFAFDPATEPEYLPNVEEDVENLANEEINDIGELDNSQEISSTSGDSSNVGTGDMRTAEFIESAISDLTDGSVGKLRQILALEPSDYSYFSKVLMRTWAGPTHWKVAPASRIGLPKGSDDKAQKKRQRKMPLRLTYDSPNQAMDKMFQVSKHVTVTPATWSKYTKKKTTLPMDKQLDTQDSLFRLFEKPKLMIKRQASDSIGLEDDIENYDYNNRNDVENYCPIARDADDNDDYSSGGFDLSNETNFPQASQDLLGNSNLSESGLNGTSITQDKLVAAPHRVERIDIKYAKTAKQVDVKRLKSTLWNILVKDKDESTNSLSGDKTPASEELLQKMMSESNFQVLKDKLPLKISSTMAKNLTIQTVFACLLYITNEKTLKLSSTDTMDDILIAQDN
ncbi:hypothetical protein RRG08_054716 [Elysia crispata]|uniref:Condensin complex subunit 2 n=1 Tax=Elysia crispata TaxID=231223 RepID=A0AAE1E9C9_9GAST|nr:hypothetical protein RRG08_054716 [Elysia crispata]